MRLRLFTLLFSCLVAGLAQADERPNILFCIMDDATWKHMSAYGCEWMDTPAFDRVAEEGILFRRSPPAGFEFVGTNIQGSNDDTGLTHIGSCR